MRLAGIRPGDIIRAGGMHALVLERRPRILIVKGLGSGSMRRIRAVEVEEQWHRARHRDPHTPDLEGAVRDVLATRR
jgi:hypothetical protein